MAAKKLSTRELLRRVDAGDSYAQIGKDYGISRQAVQKRVKELRGKTTKITFVDKKAVQIMDYKIDAMEQLQKINNYANELLELLMRWNRGDDEALQTLESQMRKVRVGKEKIEVTEIKFKDPRQLSLSCMAEIRGQLRLQLEIFQALFDMAAAKEFMDEVLNVIAEVAPDARDRIISNLNKKRAVRSAFKFN